MKTAVIKGYGYRARTSDKYSWRTVARKVVKEKQRTNNENVETEELTIRDVTLVPSIPELTTNLNNIARKHRFTGEDSKTANRV